MEEKKKKPIFKKWWFWVIIAVIIIFAIAGSGGSGENGSSAATPTPAVQATPIPAPTPTPEPTPEPTPTVPTYSDGQYKVGTDIEAGEYVLISSRSAYFEVDKDSTGTLDSILANDNFINRSIITVSDGEYLKLSGCTAYAFEDAPAVTVEDGILPEGMYKVGVDLDAGEYKVSPDGSGYVEVSSDSTHDIYSIVSNDILSGDQYITVSDGQYLKLSSAHLIVD